MGLMEQAVNTAQTQQERNAAAAKTNERKRGQVLAAKFAEGFGIDAVWLDKVVVVDYQKKYRDFGGPEWRKRGRRTDRLQVDDVVVGVTEKSYNSSSDYDYVVWSNCPSCTTVTPRTLRYVTSFGEPEKRRADLVAAIGQALTSTEPCTVCQARPCECCGRSN